PATVGAGADLHDGEAAAVRPVDADVQAAPVGAGPYACGGRAGRAGQFDHLEFARGGVQDRHVGAAHGIAAGVEVPCVGAHRQIAHAVREPMRGDPPVRDDIDDFDGVIGGGGGADVGVVRVRAAHGDGGRLAEAGDDVRDTKGVGVDDRYRVAAIVRHEQPAPVGADVHVADRTVVHRDANHRGVVDLEAGRLMVVCITHAGTAFAVFVGPGAKVRTSHARDDLAAGSTGLQHRKALTRLVFVVY